MHPAAMYDVARAKMNDELQAADRRRLAKVAAEARPPRSGGASIVGRFWTLITGVNPARTGLAGSGAQ